MCKGAADYQDVMEALMRKVLCDKCNKMVEETIGDADAHDWETYPVCKKCDERIQQIECP